MNFQDKIYKNLMMGKTMSYFSRGEEIGHGNKGSYEPLILPSVQTDP